MLPVFQIRCVFVSASRASLAVNSTAYDPLARVWTPRGEILCRHIPQQQLRLGVLGSPQRKVVLYRPVHSIVSWRHLPLPPPYLLLDLIRILQHLPLWQTLLMCFTTSLPCHIILMMRAHLHPFGILPKQHTHPLFHLAPLSNTRCETLDQFLINIRLQS